MQTNTFRLKFGGLSLAVTLKIISRSPKPIQFFIVSKCYIHANLVKIRQLVHEILCTQASLCPQLRRSCGSILVSGCPSVRPCIRASVRSSKTLHARVLKFHIWSPYRKIADPYFFSCPSYLPFWSYAPLKTSERNLVSKISRNVFELGA